MNDTVPSLTYYKEIASLNQEHRVFLVQHTQSKKIFVKKTLHVFNLDVYKTLSTAAIKGIPRIENLCIEDDKLIIIEEYISGQSLLEMLESRYVFSDEEITSIIGQLCDIVAQLHNLSVPIIHRDIKPSNILLTADKTVYLIDLNAAKFVDENKPEDTVLLGTQGYAAPEQYGFGSSTVKTDIYSIGILINTLLTHDPRIPADDSSRLYPVILKCTQINPKQRYKSVRELKQALLSRSSFHHTVYSKDDSWRIPGFRSGNPLNICIAIIGYIAIASLSFSLKDAHQTSLAIILYERTFVFLALIATVFFACDYRGINRRLPLCNSDKTLLRLIGIILFSSAFLTGLFIILVIIEIIIF